MAKEAIRLTYDKNVYELTFTRETVKQLEQAGFNLRELVEGSKTANMFELLFTGAFAARHRKTKRKVISEIYEHLNNKGDLIAALVELYSETLETLTDTAAVDDGKNVTWEAV